MNESVDARKSPIPSGEVTKVLEGIEQLYVAKGTSIVHVDLKKERPSEESLKTMLVGPTGNLRAPTLRRNKTLIVGFNGDMYHDLLGE